ncbi:MAG: type II toxin-antitoxin system PemK/MazF family toxin [Clostridium sp.]
MTEKIVRKGDIFYADLSPVIGSEQGGIRPVVILQNDVGNRFSQTTIVAMVTSKITKANMPTHISIDAEQYGLNKKSTILIEQIRTIDKRRIKEKLCKLNQEDIKKIDKAILISFGIK